MKQIFFYIAVLFFNTALFAQEAISLEDQLQFENRVKQLDQFVSRFNGEETLKGDKVVPSKESKQKVWNTIFAKNMLNGDKFFKQVLESNSGLDIRSTTDLFASLKCKVKFEGKAEELTFILVQEGNRKDGYRWAIRAAKADFLLVKADKKQIGMVNPTAHNTNFMDLNKAFKADKANIPNYAWKDYEPDYLTLVIYLIKNNKILVEQRSDVSFFFFDIKNWIVKLDHFPMITSETNSGWLISDLIEDKDTQTDKLAKVFFILNK